MLLMAGILGVIGTFLSAIEDWRTTEVPDWLSFGLIFAGLGTNLIFSIAQNNYSFIQNSVVGLIIGIAIGYLMFYTRQWGGGDAKLLMGMGALIGFDITNLTIVPPFVLFLINILIFGAIYGLGWSFYKAIQNRKVFAKAFKKNLCSPNVTRVRKLNLLIMLLLFVGIMLSSSMYKTMFFGFMLFIYVTLYLWIFVKSIEESCMIKKINVGKLTEGDWVLDEIKIKGKKICGPKDLGITQKQIDLLKKGKIKKITVKQGIPFTPTFFLAFVALLLFGNWFMGFI